MKYIVHLWNSLPEDAAMAIDGFKNGKFTDENEPKKIIPKLNFQAKALRIPLNGVTL